MCSGQRFWSVPTSGGVVSWSDRVSPSDRSLRRSLTRSFARSAWAQTPISVSWRTQETFYCNDGGPTLLEIQIPLFSRLVFHVVVVLIQAGESQGAVVSRVGGTFTGELPRRNYPKNLGSPEILLGSGPTFTYLERQISKIISCLTFLQS